MLALFWVEANVQRSSPLARGATAARVTLACVCGSHSGQPETAMLINPAAMGFFVFIAVKLGGMSIKMPGLTRSSPSETLLACSASQRNTPLASTTAKELGHASMLPEALRA